jgi:RNA polymerase sporulation-specific sigma factor
MKLFKQTNKDKYLWKLIQINEKICQRFAHKYCNIGEEHEDLLSICKLLLIKSIKDFDINRGLHFTTFAYSVLSMGLNDVLRTKKRRHIHTVSLDNKIPTKDGSDLSLVEIVQSEDAPVDSQLLLEEEKSVLHMAVQSLPPRHREIVDLLYIQGLTQVEVSHKLGTSQAHISRTNKVALSKLKYKLKDIERCG